jgi:hypothetical protein
MIRKINFISEAFLVKDFPGRKRAINITKNGNVVAQIFLRE